MYFEDKETLLAEIAKITPLLQSFDSDLDSLNSLENPKRIVIPAQIAFYANRVFLANLQNLESALKTWRETDK